MLRSNIPRLTMQISSYQIESVTFQNGKVNLSLSFKNLIYFIDYQFIAAQLIRKASQLHRYRSGKAQ